MTVEVPALEVRGLYKAFGDLIAVNNISLSIPQGAFYGLVGPNGAGKTTLLSMVTGLLTPGTGQVLIHGIDLWARPEQAKPLLGVLPDGLFTFDRLTGAELISYAGLLRGLDSSTVEQRRDDLIDALDLGAGRNKLVADFSAGMTKKVGLACAMIHAPEVLILDEPFEAVDPVSAGAIRAILHDYVQSGGTVVLSSHVMALVERICDHVAIIGNGHVLAAGTLAEVRGGADLEERFVELVGQDHDRPELSWLRRS